MSRNFKITLAYDGAGYHGWQIQPGLLTVQGTVAEAIGRVTGENVAVEGSGRTDAGVHALGQVASFRLESAIPAENLVAALNHRLPADIRVLAAAEAPPGFHARHSATSKLYHYRILHAPIALPHLARYVCHHPYPLDEAALERAAAMVTGEHDFTSFASVDPEKRAPEAETADGNRRHIFSSRFTRQGEELVYAVEGSGFLHHMVRNLVGTFLLVGKGRIEPQRIEFVLKAKDRSSAGPTAPASGLWLMAVKY